MSRNENVQRNNVILETQKNRCGSKQQSMCVISKPNKKRPMDDPVATTLTLRILLYGDGWFVPDQYLYEIVRTDISEPVRLVQAYGNYVCMYHLYYDPVANFRSNGRLFFTPLLKTPSTRVKPPSTKQTPHSTDSVKLLLSNETQNKQTERQ